MKYIATVHVHVDVEAETEEQARDIVRNRVLGAGLRFSLHGPGHGVEGVRLDVPLSERRKWMGKRDDDVQVEGLVIGGMTGGTVRIGGREVEIGEDGRPVETDEDES